MAQMINVLQAQFFALDGKPLAGGTVRVYEPGTVTPKVTYNSSACTVQNVWPVVLDYAGQADIYVQGSCRVQVFDRLGVLIEDTDGLQDVSQLATTAATAASTASGHASAAASSATAASASATTASGHATNASSSATAAADSASAAAVTKSQIDALMPTIQSASGGYRPFATLSALNAYAGSDKANFVAYVLNDGAYTWSGSAWTKSQTDHETRIQSNESKLSGAARQLTSVNLLNPSTCTDGVRLNTTTGATYASAGYSTSDFISITAGTTYRKSDANKIWWYNSAKAAMSYETQASQPYIATAPTGAAYCRIELATSAKGVSYMLTENSKWPAAYTAYSTALSIADLLVDSALVAKVKALLTISKTNTDFISRSSPNLFNVATAISGARVVPASGALVYDYASGVTSDYIPVSGSTTYSQTESNYWAEYDANKTYITGYTAGASLTVATQPNTAFVRVTVRNTILPTYMFVQSATQPTVYVPYDRWVFDPTIAITAGDSSSTRWQGKKWNAMGDSITADAYSYWRKISQNLGFATARNYGIGGTSLAYRTGDGTPLYVDNYMAKRYTAMDDDADLVTVAGGTNDFKQVPLGTYGDTTDSTVYGALHVLLTGLVDKYPTATIAFILPFSRYDSLTAVSPLDGTRFMDLHDAIIKMCRKFSIPYFDSNKLPLRLYDLDQRNLWTNVSIATGLPDGLHPNQLCHETIIAPIIQKWLLTL